MYSCTCVSHQTCYQKDWLKVLWSDFKYPQTSGTGGILIWFYWNCANLRKTEPKIKFIFSVSTWSWDGDFCWEWGRQQDSFSSALWLWLVAGASLEQHFAISCAQEEIFCSLFFLEIFCGFFFPLQFLSPLHLKSEFISVSIKQVTHFHIILHSKHLLSLEDALSSPQVWTWQLRCKILSVI